MRIKFYFRKRKWISMPLYRQIARGWYYIILPFITVEIIH